jgi:hypothetical protein
VGNIINEKVGRKLQRVKTIQRYNGIKISPWYHKMRRLEESCKGLRRFRGIIRLRYLRVQRRKSLICGWYHKREGGKEATKGGIIG